MWGSLSVVLFTFLFTTLVPLAIRLLAGLGIGFVVFTGSQYAVDAAKTYIITQYAGLPADTLALMDMAGFSTGLHVIFSAYTANLAIKASLGAMERYRARPSVLRA